MERWTVDPDFSAVSFSLPQMGPTTPRGRFARLRGSFTTQDGTWLSADVELHIDVTSLATGNKDADTEALSEGFFDAGRYPEITFRSTGVESVEDNRLIVLGDLAIRDSTHPIRVDVEFVGRARDLAGDDRMSWEINASVSRSEYGLTWRPALENVAGFIIGDRVKITGELEFVRET